MTSVCGLRFQKLRFLWVSIDDITVKVILVEVKPKAISQFLIDFQCWVCFPLFTP